MFLRIRPIIGRARAALDRSAHAAD